MKLNLEIELDWIDEQKGLDETVKEQIIDSVVSKIQKGVTDKVEKKISDTIDLVIVAKINEKTDAMFNDFISRPITLTDSYGSKVEVWDNLEALIKKRFDNFMEQKVDDQGRTTTSNYGNTYSRINYIVDKQLKDYASKFTTEAVAKVGAEIKTHVQEGLTQKLGAELMKVLKVDKMLEIGKG